MEFNDNSAIFDTVLCILNDDGTRCGLSHAQRREAAVKGLVLFEQACATYSSYRAAQYKTRRLTTEEVKQAATILQSHYQADRGP